MKIILPKMKSDNKLKYSILIISAILFIISLTQNALTVNNYDRQKIDSGISLLFMGILAILGGGLFEWLIWLANPLFIAGIIFYYNDDKLCVYLSGGATILGISFSTWKEILASESGSTASIEKLNIGYWLWILSFIVLFIGTIYYTQKIKTNTKLQVKNEQNNTIYGE